MTQYTYTLKDVIAVLERFYFGTTSTTNDMYVDNYQTKYRSKFENEIIEKIDVFKILDKLNPKQRYMLHLLGQRYQFWEIEDMVSMTPDEVAGYLTVISRRIRRIQTPKT